MKRSMSVFFDSNQLIKMKSICIYSVIALLMLGCSGKESTHPYTDLEKYILDLPEIEVTQKNVNLNRERVHSLLSNIENSIPNKIFLIDYSTWSLFMANRDGILLDQKGGVGRGPGEFSVINDLYTYIYENVLQVFDKKSKRLTYYNIYQDSLKLSHTVQLPNYGQHYLQSVYKSKGNLVGIFRVLRQHKNEEVENKLYVYYLDKEYKKREKILEIEGNELIEVEDFNGEKRFRENIFGNETVWSFDNDRLYYSNSENLNFSVFDFEDETISNYKITDVPEFLNTSQTSNLMTSRYSQIFNIHPEYEDYFKERKRLPYLSSIYARNDFLYLPIKNYGSERGYILRYDLETSQMERIETPANFFMKGVNQIGIYGTLAENDYYGKTTISILEFESVN